MRETSPSVARSERLVSVGGRGGSISGAIRRSFAALERGLGVGG